MKKALSLLLTIIMTVALTACGAEPTVDSGESQPLPTPDSTQNIEVNGEDAFEIQMRVAKYGKKNIAYLRVENKSDNAYNVKVTGNYIAANGNKTPAEEQSFDAFPARYTKYFLFNPEKAFEDFEYNLSATKFNGETVAQYFVIGEEAFSGINMGNVHKVTGEYLIPVGAEQVAQTTMNVCIGFSVGPLKVTREAITHYTSTIVIMNGDGEVIYIGTKGGGNCNFIVDYEYSGLGGYPMLPTKILWENRSEFVMPEEYKNLSGFAVLETLEMILKD
ncbi:MAG: hypothetical protein J6L92_04825 [Clostridia bacterium]|nr:hypothetical protein [Clostridia bacterium]